MKRKWKQSCQQDEEPELYDAIKDVAPEWWDEDTRIVLHRNNTLKRHKDRNDNEHSWILWLGHYSGGALNFDDGKRIRGQQEWHKINGQIPHWYDPHQGTKYSVLLSRGMKKNQTEATSTRHPLEPSL